MMTNESLAGDYLTVQSLMAHGLVKAIHNPWPAAICETDTATLELRDDVKLTISWVRKKPTKEERRELQKERLDAAVRDVIQCRGCDLDYARNDLKKEYEAWMDLQDDT